MVRMDDDGTPSLAKALAALNNRDLTAMVNWLSVPKPRPTRKADIVAVADTYEPSAAAARTSLTVFPDLRLRAGEALSADEQLMLETFAEVEAEGVWGLARERTLAAFEGGHNADGLRAFLAARDDHSLPERVEGFLRSIARAAGALKARGTAMRKG